MGAAPFIRMERSSRKVQHEWEKSMETICTLPDGEQIIVRVVNALQRAEARERAEWAAAEAIRPYLEGALGWRSAMLRFEELGQEGQSQFLAEENLMTMNQEEDRRPLPPVRAFEEEPESFCVRQAEWQAQCIRKRQGGEGVRQERMREAREAALAMENGRRIESCCRAYGKRRWREAFALRFLLETLAIAVRERGSTSIRRFKDSDAVSDIDDASREILAECYLKLDSVRASEVPTSLPDC